jgi:hypothetical protein
MKNTLVIADTHLPFEKDGYLDFCKRIHKKLNCTRVVHIGDLCFPENAEVMTQDGFKKFSELSKQDLVMQVHDDGTGELVKPSRIVDKTYTGIFYEHQGRSFSSITTEGHNLIIYNKKYKKVCTQDLPKSTFYRIPRAVNYCGEGIDFTDDEIRLQVAIRADFSKSQKGVGFRASFKKDRKKNRIEHLLRLCNIKYSKTIDSRDKYVRFFILSSPECLKYKKELREDWLTKMTSHQAIIYLKELEHWDGYRDGFRNRTVFSTKHYDEALFIQTLAHINGIQATITENKYGQKRVNILWNKKDTRTTFLKTTKHFVSLKRVMCVTVDTGMILVRQCGNISVSGNCDNHAISYHEHDPDGWSPGDEMNEVDKRLKLWFKAFPEVYLCRGNHDNLVDRKGKTVGLPRRCFAQFRDMWKLPNGWKDGFSFVFDDVCYMHGSSSGKFGHIQHAIDNRMSTVIGHIHSTAGIEYLANERDVIFAMCVGCGLDRHKYAFEYGKMFRKKPIVACGVVSNTKYGSYGTVYTMPLGRGDYGKQS